MLLGRSCGREWGGQGGEQHPVARSVGALCNGHHIHAGGSCHALPLGEGWLSLCPMMLLQHQGVGLGTGQDRLCAGAEWGVLPPELLPAGCPPGMASSVTAQLECLRGVSAYVLYAVCFLAHFFLSYSLPCVLSTAF